MPLAEIIIKSERDTFLKELATHGSSLILVTSRSCPHCRTSAADTAKRCNSGCRFKSFYHIDLGGATPNGVGMSISAAFNVKVTPTWIVVTTTGGPSGKYPSTGAPKLNAWLTSNLDDVFRS